MRGALHADGAVARGGVQQHRKVAGSRPAGEQDGVSRARCLGDPALRLADGALRVTQIVRRGQLGHVERIQRALVAWHMEPRMPLRPEQHFVNGPHGAPPYPLCYFVILLYAWAFCKGLSVKRVPPPRLLCKEFRFRVELMFES